MRVAFVIALAACGGGSEMGPDLEGTYTVTSNLVGACDATAGDSPDPVAQLQIANADGASVATCVEPTICGVPVALPTPIQHGWAGTGAAAESHESGRVCVYTYREFTLVHAGPQVTFATTTYSADGGMTDPCTVDEALARNTAMPCQSHATIEATLE